MTILNLDCRDGLALLPTDSVDSIVCDPPYGISFMGKKWDCDLPGPDIWVECLRVLKPGGYLLAFAGTRTQHRMAVRIEGAGFEIRDIIAWVYGSGFPKHQSSLKPAFEPITLARKPDKTATLLNIDACRIATEEALRAGSGGIPCRHDEVTCRGPSEPADPHPLGRYPANFIHDGSDEVLAGFPTTTSGKPSGIKAGNNNNVFGQYAGGIPVTGFGDSGSAARFFYCAKASKQDRNEGLEAFEAVMPKFAAGTGLSKNGDGSARNMGATAKNSHPTVKPTDLMRYLCRLVTPPGGLIVDPFAGSGSTGKAAVLEGFQFVGFELDPQYTAIANARIDAARASLVGGEFA